MQLFFVNLFNCLPVAQGALYALPYSLPFAELW